MTWFGETLVYFRGVNFFKGFKEGPQIYTRSRREPPRGLRQLLKI